ncbi:MAG: T9SS type A sorting domain-containing protein, partial [Candidatus Fermentibacteria bacterium]
IESNPAYGSAFFSLHLPAYDTVSLTIYDISGRTIEEVYRGPLESGDTQWSFSAPAGMYTAMLRCEEKVESLKFIISD